MNHYEASDATVSGLWWFFRDSHSDAEIAFLLGALDMTGDLMEAPWEAFEVKQITKAREIRNRLLALPPQHADVLSWAFELRVFPARITSLFQHPGVAVRTFAAQWALACAGSEARVMTSDGQADVGRAWPGLRPAGFKQKRAFWLTEDGEFIPTNDPETNEPWTDKRRAKVYPRAVLVPERWWFPKQPRLASKPERTGKLTRVPSGDFHRWKMPKVAPEAMLAFLSGFENTSDPIVKAINDETERRVSEALRAYEGARGVGAKRRAA